MLVLERYVGQRLRIGDHVQVVVLSVREGEVRVGIVAPKNVRVYRENVYQRIRAERHAEAAMADRPVPVRRRRPRYLRASLADE